MKVSKWVTIPKVKGIIPSVGGEDISVETLAEVLDHVVTFGLTMNVDIQTKLVLDLDGVLDLLLNEAVVLLLVDLALGKLVTLDADLLGLGEGSNGGGGEQGKAEVLLLLGVALLEGRLAVVHLRGDLGLAVLDLGVVRAGRLGARLHGGSVGVELGADGLGVRHGLGEDSDVVALLNGEGEPAVYLARELLLASQGVGGVKEGARGGNNDTVLSEGLDGGLEKLEGLLEVVLPDVPAVNDTGSYFRIELVKDYSG